MLSRTSERYKYIGTYPVIGEERVRRKEERQIIAVQSVLVVYLPIIYHTVVPDLAREPLGIRYAPNQPLTTQLQRENRL